MPARLAAFEGVEAESKESSADADAELPTDERDPSAFQHRKRDGIEDRSTRPSPSASPTGESFGGGVVALNEAPAASEASGDRFGAGELILPFAQSAEVMALSLAHPEQFLKTAGQARARSSATVYGDVHIGSRR
jgi:cobalamin-dependent methionine synthase I